MTRGSGSPNLLLRLDRESGQPLYQQLYEALRGAIEAGHLRPGTRLPPTRKLAVDLDISRTTILSAYDRLIMEGILEARVGSGTWVRQDVHAHLPLDGRRDAFTSLFGGDGTGTLVDGPTPVPREQGTPFQLGVPALDLFPLSRWSRIAARHWREATHRTLTYGGNAGYPPLREAIAGHIAASRGVRCTAEQIIITEGAQQAIDIASRALLGRGDALWIEEPGYPGVRGRFQDSGVRTVPVPVDGSGLQVDRALELAPDARAAYVTPSHQFPLGVALSRRRRSALLDWADARDAWIIEDDYDAEFRYSGPPVPALQAQDSGERVLYVGSFSKTLFPSLRLGYLVSPPNLVETLVGVRAYAGQHSPTVNQAILAEFIQEGHYALHLRQMKTTYRDRRDTLLRSLGEEAGDLLRPGPADAGMHLACELPSGVEGSRIATAAGEREIHVVPLSSLFDVAPDRDGLVLGYASVRRPRIVHAVRSLGELVREEMGRVTG